MQDTISDPAPRPPKRRSSDDGSVSSFLGGFSGMDPAAFRTAYPDASIQSDADMQLPTLDDKSVLDKLLREVAQGIVLTGELVAVTNEKSLYFYVFQLLETITKLQLGSSVLYTVTDDDDDDEPQIPEFYAGIEQSLGIKRRKGGVGAGFVDKDAFSVQRL
jgi:hypothetical protein